MTSAKIHISLQDGVLQLEGSEEFVAAQIARLEPHIADALRARRANDLPDKPSKNGGSGKQGGGAEQGDKPDLYDEVFAESDGKIRVLKSLPGDSDAERTVNAALLIGWAALQERRESITAEEVREVVKAHGCLNSSNFSGYLKSETQFLIIEGKARSPSKIIRLTMPGRRRGEELFRQVAAA